MTVPNATAYPIPGQTQQTGGLNNNGDFITPSALPPVNNSAGNLLTTLKNQLAGQQIKLFQDLFPITEDYNLEQSAVSNPDGVVNQQIVLQDLYNLKLTVLSINQIATAPSRLPANANIGNSGTQAATQAGLTLNVITRINNIIQAAFDNNFTAAQSDYVFLRDNFLIPYYAL